MLYEELPPATLEGSGVSLAAELEVATGVPVDLVHRVLRDGILLVERDRNARVLFEVSARNAYFDLKPHLDRYRRTAERQGGR